MARPNRLLPAHWAHWSWLSPPRPPRHERELGQASLQLLRAYPQLGQCRVGWLPVPRGRPAFARVCRLAAASAAAAQVRRSVGIGERRLLAAYIGRQPLDQLQRRTPAAFETDEPIDLSDRFLLTARGLALFCLAHQGQGLDAWWSLRLPRALSEEPRAFAPLDRQRARACVSDALRLWRTRC